MKSTFYNLLLTLFFVALGSMLSSNAALGQDDEHAGDIEFEYSTDQIILMDAEEASASDASFIFESDFGVDSFAGFTDEPGFISETDIGLGIGANDIVGYNVLSNRFNETLSFWNPVSGQLEDTSATLTISDNPGGTLQVSQTSVAGDGMGTIGQADDTGDFHTHIDFQLSPNASSSASTGCCCK